MKFQLFCMFDKQAGVFLQPFCARSENDARRQLTLGFEDPGFLSTPAGRYPQEFAMYHVGAFEDESAVITVPTAPRFVVNLMELRPIPPASTVPS